jgi:very-short-patch-repair endonuclease
MDKKLEYWEHQLLDLGKRNKMINYRETKRTTIKLVEPSFGELFNRLALNEETLTFQRSVDRETDIRVFSILSLLENLSASLPVTIGDIKTEGSVLERQKTLKNLRAKSRLAQEEQGTNILYLSFGFIEWKDGKGASAQWIKSPLILVPAVLALEALNSPYTLKKHEDDIVVNPTLEYYLKTEYGIELPQFDADKDTLDDYLKSLEEIADQRGWRILREVSLGLLSFLKISMYNDLLRNEERIKKNPVIRAMSGDAAEANEIPEHLRNFDLDSISTQDCYQVMSADSSQQDAILYSKNNISFVMQGPPGTGKSQTITNIIAEALAEGKKVLFVSEKMAALQVVYRRLQEAHLGDFCLPLHSYKANKKETLEQIGANLKLKQTRVKDVAISNLEELLSIRQELNKYAEELHALNPELNISCYEVYSKLEEVNDAPTITFTLDNPLGVSQAKLQGYLKALKEYSFALERLHYAVKNNPWEGLSSRMSGYEYTEQMKAELRTITESVQGLISALSEIAELPKIGDEIAYTSVPELSDLIGSVCELPQIPQIWIEEFDFEQSINTATEAKSAYSKLFALREEIRKVFLDKIYQYDYNEWKDKLLAEANGLVDLPLLEKKTPDFFIKEAHPLYLHFEKLKAALTDAHTAFGTINDILGTDFKTSSCNQQVVVSLLELLRSNTILHKQWLSSDVAEIRSFVLEAQSVTNEIKLAKEKLLNDWEPEILNLDYAPILMRYKTEYTSVFKVFKGQYRQDKKQIQVLSKTVVKKLTDDAAIELLITLKHYHDKLHWINEKSAELSNLLGDYYKSIDSEWDVVINALNICSSLKDLLIGELPVKLIGLVTTEHSEKSLKLDTLLSDIATSFAAAKNEIETVELGIDINLVDFDVIDTLQTIELYLTKLVEVSTQTEMLKLYLVEPDEQIDVIYQTIEQLNSHSEILRLLSGPSKNHKQLFEHFFVDENTDWDNVLSLLNRVAELKKSNLFYLLTSLINISDIRKKELSVAATQIKEIYNTGTYAFDWIKQRFSVNAKLQTMTVTALSEKMIGCLNNISNLENWIDYQEAKERCTEAGLEDFIDKFESSHLYENSEKIFLKGFYHMWLGAVCDRSASVRRFRRDAQEEKIEKFIKLDDHQLLIAQMRIREKLIENLPSTNRMLKATDEVAILNKELSKKRNIMPLRKLFRMIPNLLMKLKPCLMMSPLSVSYFLETEAYHFDLVIFDEASQIFPEDAIGAIFRGSQVIIAGDSKQLPPTNFFSSTTNNFDDDYDIKDDEDFSEVVSDSILEESASVLPNCTLLWHYRSKHENLIAFSNREIYQNNLITFPSSVSNAPDMGVEYIYVEDGCYDRGGKKNNIREAEECVRLVFEHIGKYPDRSLGIIAFSESQQATIEDAIIDYRERDPSYEWFFDESRDEPFFVKNLENVQGDERDTIIFSICYGKDKNGAMYMNFGPVGHSGGERRLNVAITRAKCNIKLVGSILPSDIDINRAKSEGTRMLRSYIEYARKGMTVLRPIEKAETFESEDDFCKIVAKFLEEHGYTIKRQVGCSDYKIDIAVVNPNAEGEFIAGVECDGLSYASAKTARDRDHLRRSVLQNMGWNLYRVWSTAWNRNPQAEGQALLDFLNSVYDKNGKVIHAMKQSNAEGANVSIEAIATESIKVAHKEASNNPYGFAFYKEANWWEAVRSDSGDNFTRISENILHIVSVEQPIHLEVLYKRMGPSFTAGKATESVKNTIDQVIKQKLKGRVVVDKDRFVRLLPLNPIIVRIPKGHETPRPIEYIHTEEVAMAMMKIIERSFGITEEDLASECARAFGFERKGPKIKVKTDAAIKYLVKNHKIRIIDGKAQLIGD